MGQISTQLRQDCVAELLSNPTTAAAFAYVADVQNVTDYYQADRAVDQVAQALSFDPTDKTEVLPDCIVKVKEWVMDCYNAIQL